MHISLRPLEDQTIVITGASSGIGLATARAAARAGARVMLAARDDESLAGISKELNDEGCQTAFHRTDVSIESDVAALAQAAMDKFGGFDTWVNNAGVGIIGTAEQTSSDDHHGIFETNYFGLVYGSLEAVRHFRETGKDGALINLGSVVSDIPIVMSVSYGATKHAIKGFTEGLRLELQRDKVPVSITLIKPSAVDTPFFDHARTLTAGMGTAPGTFYTPDVVADAILFAATHVKRDIAVGSTAAIGGLAEGALPQVIDAQQRSMSINKLIDFGHEPSGDNLYDAPVNGAERSRFGSGRGFSISTLAQTRGASMAAPLMLLAGLSAIAILLNRQGSTRRIGS